MALTVADLDALLKGSIPTPTTSFFVGALGSITLEIAAALKLSAEMGGVCPPIYKQPFYLSVRLIFALTAAGLLPVMMSAQSIWSAFYLGVTAPLVFDRLARGLQPDGN
jgi:hypothetical protein